MGAFAHFREDQQVEEVHGPEHQQHDTHLAAQRFKDASCAEHVLRGLQVERDEADVDEVKADDEQVVHAVGQLLVAVEALDEEDAATFVKGPGDPNGEGDGEGQVEALGEDGFVHWVGSFRVWVCVCYVCSFRYY